ncbi:MAG: hypothetical protein WDZ30_10160 [Cellvibrionaceae bacterium]
MKLTTAKSEIQRWGLLPFAYDCAMSRLKRWVTLCAVNVRPLYKNPDLPRLAPEREVRMVSTDELIVASADPIYDLDPDFIKKAQGRGELCMAVFEGGKILAYLWRTFASTGHEKGLWVHFDERYVYGFKAFTHPDYRQQRLQHSLSYTFDTLLRERGYSHCIAFIETHNFPSLISDKKRGHRRVGYAGYLTLFGRVIPFRTPGARRHGFGFFPSVKPAVSDSPRPATKQSAR